MTKIYNYETGKIYCIKAKDCNKCYVGHTKQPLKVRLQKHKTDFKGYYGIDGLKPRSYRGSFEVLCESDFDIYLLEDYPCENKKELEKQESKWMFKMSSVYEITNKNMPAKLGFEDLEDIKNLHIPKCFS
jgi:hypothetical protein